MSFYTSHIRDMLYIGKKETGPILFQCKKNTHCLYMKNRSKRIKKTNPRVRRGAGDTTSESSCQRPDFSYVETKNFHSYANGS